LRTAQYWSERLQEDVFWDVEDIVRLGRRRHLLHGGGEASPQGDQNRDERLEGNERPDGVQAAGARAPGRAAAGLAIVRAEFLPDRHLDELRDAGDFTGEEGEGKDEKTACHGSIYTTKPLRPQALPPRAENYLTFESSLLRLPARSQS